MRGRPRGSRDRRGKARLVDQRVLAAVLRRYGEQIKRAREDADVSAAELAAATGYNVMTIHAWEAGRFRPGLSAVTAVAMALRIPIDHLVPEC